MLEGVGQFERNPKVFQPESPSKFNMRNPSKGSDGATGDLTSPGMPARQPEMSARREKPGTLP